MTEENMAMDARPEETAAEAVIEPAAGAADERLAALVEDLRAGIGGQLKEALAEALRLGGMTDEARAAHEADQREAALAAREAALTRRELRADAQARLTARGLPAALAEAVDCADRAAMERSVAALADAFDAAVQDAAQARLRGVSPVSGAPAPAEDDMDDATYYRMKRMMGM